MLVISLNVCFFFARESHKSHKHIGLVMPDLSIGGGNIEFVEKWPHLSHDRLLLTLAMMMMLACAGSLSLVRSILFYVDLDG